MNWTKNSSQVRHENQTTCQFVIPSTIGLLQCVRSSRSSLKSLPAYCQQLYCPLATSKAVLLACLCTLRRHILWAFRKAPCWENVGTVRNLPHYSKLCRCPALATHKIEIFESASLYPTDIRRVITRSGVHNGFSSGLCTWGDWKLLPPLSQYEYESK
jgi:hypothetical protein